MAKKQKNNQVTEVLPEPFIQGLFPTPVLFARFHREWTDDEKKFFGETAKGTTQNTGNLTSADRYVLDHPAMKEIRDYYQFYINYYMQHVYAPKYPVEAYITQSWMNYTKTGQFHHKHAHPNSWLSGCIYISTEREKDRITFYNDKYNRINIPTENFNTYNSESWWFSVGTGDIVIFPSYLTHMVEQTTSSDTRVSIAINTFLKGYIGDEHSLTGLHLKEQDSDTPYRTEPRPDGASAGY
jgi:uncharacterized protein (TIGR02466 family)